MLKRAWLLKLLLNIWPPFRFSGIKVLELSTDFRAAKVQLKLGMFNRNAVGVHFGGSLFAMTDPFYMLMILACLGDDYIVWDKSADIDFVKPGRGKVSADFLITDALINDIIAHTADGEKYLPELPVFIKNDEGEVVAKLNRKLYIRKKKSAH